MLSIMTALCLTACNNSENVSPEPDIVPEPDENQEIDYDTSVDEENSSEELTVDYSDGLLVIDGLYEKFIDGEEVVYFDKEKSVNIDDLFGEEVPVGCELDYSKGYTVDELVEAVRRAVWDDEESQIGRCTCKMIDAGADGSAEMKLMMSEFSALVWKNVQFVIKDIDGKLQCIYVICNTERLSYSISDYGVVSGGGAGYHSYRGDYIDSDGNAEMLYIEEYLYPGYNSSYVAETFQNIDPKLYEQQDKGYDVCTTILILDKKNPLENYVTSVSVYDSDGAKIDETDSVYIEIKQIYEDEGITLVSLDEQDRIINERYDVFNITEEMRNTFGEVGTAWQLFPEAKG